MKCSVVVLALGALTCALASPLGAAMWGGVQPFCGCSSSVCYCPHGSDALRGVASHDERLQGGHTHGGASHSRHHSHAGHGHEGHGHSGHDLRAAAPVKACPHRPTALSGDASRRPELAVAAGERKPTGGGCELRDCGRGSMPGTGVLPALPDGDLSASTTLPTPDLWGSPGLADPDLPPDVFPGVEPPPPRS
jgi:hypothetical protein